MVWRLLLALGLLAAQEQVPAPSQATSPAQPPVFKAGINYVDVDAAVVDSAGHFVRDLGKDDFKVYEDGKAQEISVFSRVEIPIEEIPETPALSATPILADAAANPPFNGRIFVLVLDDQQTTFGGTMRTRDAATTFVQKYVAPNDLVALVGTGGRVAQSFTTDKARALKAIERFMGQQAGSAAAAAEADATINLGLPDYAMVDINQKGNKAERVMNAGVLFSTLNSLCEYLGHIPGRRKAVVVFSGGVNLAGNDDDAVTLMGQTITAANRGNVSFYGVDTRGMVGAGASLQAATFGDDPHKPGWASQLHDELRQQHDSLQVLSRQTGGFATVDLNDLAPAFTRIVEQNSSYYVLGYYASNDKRDGKYHSVSVKVSRPDVTVRARAGYVAPNDRKPAAVEAVGNASPQLAAALASPIPVSDIPLHVSAAAFHGNGPKSALSLTIELDAASFAFTHEGDAYRDRLELAVLSASQKHKIRLETHDIIDLSLTGNYGAVREGGIRIGDRFEVEPGKYRLLVGVREGDGGVIGTVSLDVDVADFSKGDLAMSGIAMTSAAAGRTQTTHADLTFRDALPSPPTARREFRAGDTLSVFCEVYDHSSGTANAPAIATELLSSAGVVAARSLNRPQDVTRTGGTYRYATQVPLASIAPGDYTLRIRATTPGSRVRQAQREVVVRIR